MSKDNKRRDSKGRILRTGEQQRQDGKFMYYKFNDVEKEVRELERRLSGE